MKYTKEELAHVWLDSFLGLEYKHKFQLVEWIDVDKPSFNLPNNREYLTSVLGEKVYSTLISSADQVYLDYVLSGLEKREVTVVTARSINYPESLLQTPCPPFVLYCKGDTGLLNGKDNFGIVGSRKSLPLSIKLAENYCEELLEAGFTLVTGTADGVDCAVLKTAVHSNGKVISVVAGGFDHIYPAINTELIEKVAKVGLVVSEYPPETVAKPFHFPVRNRIISALSRGVLIVSGALKSGTLYTAEYALEYGKDLFAVPYNVGVQSGAGCNDLIKRGAILTDTVKDVLDYYGKQANDKKIVLNEQEKQIILALKAEQLHIEKLSASLNKRAYEIMPTLSVLEIKGLVSRNGNVYGLTGKLMED